MWGVCGSDSEKLQEINRNTKIENSQLSGFPWHFTDTLAVELEDLFSLLAQLNTFDEDVYASKWRVINGARTPT